MTPKERRTEVDYVISEIRRVPNSKIVAISGFFSPLHEGHIEYFEKAKALCGSNDFLVCILNTDEQQQLKRGFIFQNYKTRFSILKHIDCIDFIIPAVDIDQTVCETIRLLQPDIFAKGGDRFNNEIPEARVCNELGILMVDGLGAKINASSKIIEGVKEN